MRKISLEAPEVTSSGQRLRRTERGGWKVQTLYCFASVAIILSYRSDDILYYLIIQLKISKILESIFIQLRITLKYKIYQMQKP